MAMRNNFKKIGEAYEILGDADKRRMYDINKNNPFMNGGMPSEGDLLNMLFGGIGGGRMNMGGIGVLLVGWGDFRWEWGWGKEEPRPTVHIFRGGFNKFLSMPHLQKPTPIIKKNTHNINASL